MKKHLMLASLLLVAPAVYGAGSVPATIDGKAAFDRLRSLAGEWEAKTDMGAVRVTYEVIAANSAVVESVTPEGMPAMQTVYHLDGSRLLLTHYCMLGNQPRMQASAFDPATGELKFEFLDVTNLAHPSALHMHNATFHFVDGEHLLSDWQSFGHGAPKVDREFPLYAGEVEGRLAKGVKLRRGRETGVDASAPGSTMARLKCGTSTGGDFRDSGLRRR